MTAETVTGAAGDGPKFEVLRIYLKDASFEAPNSPEIFLSKENPEVNYELNTAVIDL